MDKYNPRDHVGILIKFINGKIVNRINKNLTQFNLTCVQHDTLCYIDKESKNRDVFQKDVEKRLKLTNPTVTGIVKRLEEKGMIVRYCSSTDGRYKSLHITDCGREVIQKSFKFGANNIETQLTQGMTEEEVATLKNLLFKALQNLED